MDRKGMLTGLKAEVGKFQSEGEGPVKEAVSQSESDPPRKESYDAKLTRLVKEFLEKNKKKNPATGSPSKIPPIIVPPTNNIVDDEVQYRLRQESKKLIWARMSTGLLDQQDLMGFYNDLEKFASSPPNETSQSENDIKLICYSDFLKLKKSTDPRIVPLLTARLFVRFVTDDPYGRAPIMHIFNYIMKKTWLRQTRLGLFNYDSTGKGTITDEDMESYLRELLPTLTQLQGMDPSFETFYVCTASRKFFFFLDPQRKGKVKIIDILSSGLIDDILDLRENEPRDTNWFCLETALKVYGNYLTLDKDRNGMLSKSEFIMYDLSFSGTVVALTEAFVDKLFEECMTFNGEMDYRTYVDFVLAMENRKEPQAQSYFMRILDINHKGYLDAFDLHYFYKDIEKMLKKYSTPDIPRFNDVKDEIFDMVKPKDPLKITLKDLINCGKGDTVICMLIDTNGFYDYENRENHQAQNQDQNTNNMKSSEV